MFRNKCHTLARSTAEENEGFTQRENIVKANGLPTLKYDVYLHDSHWELFQQRLKKLLHFQTSL